MKAFALTLACLAYLPLSSQTIDHWETAVYETDTWKYLVPTSAVSATWNTLSFNDASWNSGPGGFGYGDGDDNTNIGSGSSVFHRRIFSVTDTSKIEELVVNVDYDDATVIYINAVEVARFNITSAGSPPFNQFADGQHEAVMYSGGYPEQIVIDKNTLSTFLVDGPNVICVQTHNATAGSSDLSSRVWLHAGINDASTQFGTPPTWFNPPFIFSSSNLPIIILNTNNVPIPDAPKINGTMGIIYNGPGVRNYVTDSANHYNGNMGIERRGSSSGGFAKKGYGVETRDPFNNSWDVTLFNFPFDNDWVLYAPYSDKSLIRNVLTYKLARNMQRYAPRTQPCEVILNGEYQGVYILTEKIKQKTGRVDIDKLNWVDTVNNELTGGYVLKIDKLTSGGVIAWTSPFAPYTGATETIGIQLHDPGSDTIHPLQKQYIQDHITAWETALDGPNFTDPVLGFRPYMDVGSFIDYMLVDEMSKNVDGYRLSSFFYKERLSEGGRIVAGPLWDFNLAWGNANYCAGGNTTGWELDFYTVCPGGWQNPFWWKKLLQDTSYANAVNCRWQTLRQTKLHTDTILAFVDSLASYLGESQIRNFQRWPILGTYVWPNNYIGATYGDEINYLKTWIVARLNWMDQNMFGNCTTLETQELESSHQWRAFPNPADNYFTLESSEVLNKAEFVLCDMSGRIVMKKDLRNTYHIRVNTQSFSPGLYLYHVTTENGSLYTGKFTVKH